MATNETATMFRTSNVRTNALGRSAPSGRTTSARTSDSAIVATNAPNQGHARSGRPNATAPRGARSDHRIDGARLLEAADHDQPERGRDQDEEELRGPQEGEVSRPGEDDEADDRADDIAPRGERDRRLADEPVQEPPREAGREDEERDADQEPLAEAQVRRVGRIGADRQRTFDELARPPRRHDARG